MTILPMRVVHVISNLMSGGAESMLTKLVEALPEPRHRHVVITFVNGGLFAERLIQQGVRVIGLGQTKGQPLQALQKLPELRRIIADVAPDIVQGWMYHGNLAASATADRRPVIWNIRQRLERLSDNRLATQATILGSILYRRSVRAVIYNSAHAASEHEAWGYPRDRRVLIPNGFDLGAFQPDPRARAALRAELGLPEEALLVGRVARDDAIKDTPTLLKAFATLRNLEARLILVGRGMSVSKPVLGDQLRALGLTGRVHLLGERSDIPRINAALDLAVLSSSHGEGFPNVVCEAMASATPVVSTDAGECRDIIGDAARIVPVRNAAALCLAIERVLSLEPSERRAIGEQDRARVSQFYALPMVAESYAALWQRVAGK